MKTLREQLTGKCKHYNGAVHKSCSEQLAGAGDGGIMSRLPCFGKQTGHCEKCEPYTEAEIAKEIADSERAMRCIQEGLSSCCEAPLDTRNVITEGRYKGHGPRYCSKCKQIVFMV